MCDHTGANSFPLVQWRNIEVIYDTGLLCACAVPICFDIEKVCRNRAEYNNTDASFFSLYSQYFRYFYIVPFKTHSNITIPSVFFWVNCKS